MDMMWIFLLIILVTFIALAIVALIVLCASAEREEVKRKKKLQRREADNRIGHKAGECPCPPIVVTEPLATVSSPPAGRKVTKTTIVAVTTEVSEDSAKADDPGSWSSGSSGSQGHPANRMVANFLNPSNLLSYQDQDLRSSYTETSSYSPQLSIGKGRSNQHHSPGSAGSHSSLKAFDWYDPKTLTLVPASPVSPGSEALLVFNKSSPPPPAAVTVQQAGLTEHQKIGKDGHRGDYFAAIDAGPSSPTVYDSSDSPKKPLPAYSPPTFVSPQQPSPAQSSGSSAGSSARSGSSSSGAASSNDSLKMDWLDANGHLKKQPKSKN
jgi:hypothetical protein